MPNVGSTLTAACCGRPNTDRPRRSDCSDPCLLPFVANAAPYSFATTMLTERSRASAASVSTQPPT